MGSKFTLVIISTIFLVLLTSFSSSHATILGAIEEPILFEDTQQTTQSVTECTSTPTDGCVVTSSTTFNPGTYNLPNGIFIQADGITLDCNGAILKGTTSTAASGIFMDGRTGNTIKNCVVDRYREGTTSRGIHLINSDNNILENNIIKSNWHGIEFDSGSDNNLLTQNTIRDNNGNGIKLDSGSNNNIYNNNFISNVVQASDSGSNNWDSGDYLTGGNYWSDHSCVDTAEPFDICDNAYTLGFTDNYPFEFESGWDLNRAPILDFIDDVTINEGEMATIYANAIDPNGDELDYVISPPENWVVTSGSSATFEWQTDFHDDGVYQFLVSASDGEFSDEQWVTVTVNWCSGDVNDDGGRDILDLVYIVDWMFRGGPAPQPLESMNVNGDGQNDITDLTYYVDWMFRDGSYPVCS